MSSERNDWTLKDFEGPGDWFMDGPEYKDPNGCSYGGAVSAIASGMFGFCGCGRPEDALSYVLGGLDLVARLKDEVWTDKIHYETWADANRKHFGSSGAEYFFWYWASTEHLIEHGGCVPGWLTERGETMRDDIRKALLEDPE